MSVDNSSIIGMHQQQELTNVCHTQQFEAKGDTDFDNGVKRNSF